MEEKGKNFTEEEQYFTDIYFAHALEERFVDPAHKNEFDYPPEVYFYSLPLQYQEQLQKYAEMLPSDATHDDVYTLQPFTELSFEEEKMSTHSEEPYAPAPIVPDEKTQGEEQKTDILFPKTGVFFEQPLSVQLAMISHVLPPRFKFSQLNPNVRLKVTCMAFILDRYLKEQGKDISAFRQERADEQEKVLHIVYGKYQGALFQAISSRSRMVKNSSFENKSVGDLMRMPFEDMAPVFREAAFIIGGEEAAEKMREVADLPFDSGLVLPLGMLLVPQSRIEEYFVSRGLPGGRSVRFDAPKTVAIHGKIPVPRGLIEEEERISMKTEAAIGMAETGAAISEPLKRLLEIPGKIRTEMAKKEEMMRKEQEVLEQQKRDEEEKKKKIIQQRMAYEKAKHLHESTKRIKDSLAKKALKVAATAEGGGMGKAVAWITGGTIGAGAAVSGIAATEYIFYFKGFLT